ncbi:hypothetical protein KQI10_03770 [Pseudoflavonifractor sp. MSJ-30]|nr:hypothetical protein [Pseudoflavonifractor sp. MSJ-30]
MIIFISASDLQKEVVPIAENREIYAIIPFFYEKAILLKRPARQFICFEHSLRTVPKPDDTADRKNKPPAALRIPGRTAVHKFMALSVTGPHLSKRFIYLSFSIKK